MRHRSPRRCVVHGVSVPVVELKAAPVQPISCASRAAAPPFHRRQIEKTARGPLMHSPSFETCSVDRPITRLSHNVALSRRVQILACALSARHLALGHTFSMCAPAMRRLDLVEIGAPFEHAVAEPAGQGARRARHQRQHIPSCSPPARPGARRRGLPPGSPSTCCRRGFRAASAARR